jgi:DNA polymerase-3 subunit epsilon
MSESTHSCEDRQLSWVDLETEEALSDLTFVVVDLETTGGPASQAGITEIGAVKVRGGQVHGEFATLVQPEGSIPAHIQALTGITNSMVRDAPSVAGAVAAFGEFAGDAVLVAHNAPYDLGFLKAACTKHDLSWFPGRSLDTARLARVALQRGEVRNCKLATLASYFHSPVVPEHRALADARATTHVLHCLLERVGSFSVHTWSDLRGFISRVSADQRAKRHLADGLPTGPGVYSFIDAQGSALYIGTSRNVRHRVRSYFTASESRARMAEMISIAVRVDAIPCATSLEAQIRELRAIADKQPRYNRRSRTAATSWWLRITEERAPRLVTVKAVGEAKPEEAWGPFPSRASARTTAGWLADATGLRSCTGTLPIRPRATTPQCLRGHLAQCASPCMDGYQDVDYQQSVNAIRAVFAGNVSALVQYARHRMDHLAQQERFEEAAEVRDEIAAVCAASERHHRVSTLIDAGLLVAASPDGIGGWDIHVIDRGRLVAATHAPAKTNAQAAVKAALATAEEQMPGAGTLAEAVLLAQWLEKPGVRLISAQQPLSWPASASSAFASACKMRAATIVGADRGHTSAMPVGPAPGVQRVSRMSNAAHL